MSKEMENKLLPKLRFPEFIDSGDWQEEQLGEISEIVRGGSPRPIQDYLTTNKNGLNWLKIADVPSDSKYIIYTKERVIPQALSSTRQVTDGDLILSNSMSFGRPYILKITTCIHDGWIAIRKISKLTFEDYLYYFISSEPSQRYFNSQAAGAAVKNLNAEIIKLLPVYFPKSKEEQQKIAHCLSSLDDLITAETEKLDALKEHKKGLMQQLFPAEGEKLPKLRFPEFKNSGDWEEDVLGNVATFLKGKGISKADITTNGSLACIRYGELYTHYSEIIDEVISFTDVVEEELVLSEKFDVIIPSSGETQIDIATASCVISQGIALGGDLNIIRSNINGIFMAYYLSHNKKIAIAKMAQGNAVVHLYNNQLKRLQINFPSIRNEQNKISDCLSSLDKQIGLQKQKIEDLKLHKKGLMQGLFPNIN